MKKLSGFLICALALTVGLYAVDRSGDPLEMPPIKNTQHWEKVKAAFDADEYYIDSYIEYPRGSGKFGIRAASKYALNYETGSPKLAFYLEGKPAAIGYQMGYLAEPEIALMTTIFVKLIPADFIDPQLPLEKRIKIGKILNRLMLPGVRKLAESTAIPAVYKDEIKGILKGCQDANPYTRVTEDGLELLNYGMDVLFSIVYEGSLPQREEIDPQQLKIPFMCSAFSLKGTRNGEDYHYFGRNFQFDTGGVFQDTACMIIYNPDSTFNGIKALPSVVQAAPGMVGGVTILNINGVAMGVDMCPSHACDPANPGLDSLLMVRHSVQYGENADETVARVREATRGVSWLYPFADGSTGKAGVIETIKTIKSISYKSPKKLADYLYSFPLQMPDSRVLKVIMGEFIAGIKEYIPNSDFIQQHMQQYENLKTGIFVRWSDYNYPSGYLDYNAGLWNWYNECLSRIFKERYLHENGLSASGAIDRTTLNQAAQLEYEKNCPLNYYFAPQREDQPGEVLVSNFFISPELRYTAMHYWPALLLGGTQYLDDLQWRYDTLNYLIYLALKNGGGSVDKKTARKLIDFLNPQTGQFPGYYIKSPRSRDGKAVRIGGSISLCDLKARTMESLFGYYSDHWVTITLPRYFE